MRLAKALRLYWFNCDRLEGLRWLRELCSPAWRHGPPHLRARLHSSLGHSMLHSLSLDGRSEGSAVLEEGVQISREIGDMWALAEACRHLGEAAIYTEDLAGAEVWFVESLVAARAADSPWNIAWTLLTLGLVASKRGDDHVAAQLYEECLLVFQRLGIAGGVGRTVSLYTTVLLRLGSFDHAATLLDETLDSFELDLSLYELWALYNQRGQVAYAQFDLRRALELFVQALWFGRKYGQQVLQADDSGILQALLGELAVVATALGHHVHATHLFCHARDRLYDPQPNLVQAQIGASLAACRTALGEEAFDAAWAAGQAMTLDEAVTEALAFTAGELSSAA
jgi:tetratricopeptide (TPR) repeat protein